MPNSSTEKFALTETLLGKNEEKADDFLEEAITCQNCSQRNRTLRLRTTIVIHGAIISLYTIIFIWVIQNLRTSNTSSSLVFSPAHEAIEIEKHFFHGELMETNKYKGEPRPELDKAWNDLLMPTSIRISDEAYKKLNRTDVSPVKLSDGTGYMGTLDVYHQLHCLWFVRRYIHPEAYAINSTNVPLHVDHCLDVIRQYIMCKADVAVNMYEWIPNYPRPWPSFTTEHQCANWDTLHEWAIDHSFDGFDKTLISHPDYHPELPLPYPPANRTLLLASSLDTHIHSEMGGHEH